LIDEETPEENPSEPAPEPAAEETPAPAPESPAEDGAPEAPALPSEPAPETPADEPAEAEQPAPPAEAPAAEAPAAPEAEAPAAPEAEAPAAPEAEAPAAPEDAGDDDAPETPRVKPEIPGADLEVDLVIDSEGDDRPTYSEDADPDAEGAGDDGEDAAPTKIAEATIDLGADARYLATGKRKTAIARVILRPGKGAYTINGKDLDIYFPRPTLLRQIREPLETVGYEDRMDVVASLQGGGVSAQAGALRHGISRALLEADPNLRTELKRRGFLTRDSRAKERKKAGLKKARKRPQFSKR
jgi:small subunit ribosomal protein S9